MDKEKQGEEETIDDCYCKVCGGCGYIGCDGVRGFLEKHVKGKTDCSEEATFIQEIIEYVDLVKEEAILPKPKPQLACLCLGPYKPGHTLCEKCEEKEALNLPPFPYLSDCCGAPVYESENDADQCAKCLKNCLKHKNI